MTCDGPGIPWTCIHKTIPPSNTERRDKFVMVYEDNSRLERSAARYMLPSTQMMSVPVSNSDQKARVKLYFPPNFDQNAKYPMVVYVYGGPGFQLVDDQWNQYDYQTYLTGQGFIYAIIDPKGSGFQVFSRFCILFIIEVYFNYQNQVIINIITVSYILRGTIGGFLFIEHLERPKLIVP